MKIRCFAIWSACQLMVLQQLASVSGQDQLNEHNEARRAFQRSAKALEKFNASHSRIFKGGRVPIRYLEWTCQGTPLVLLHGTYSSAHDFVRFAPSLIESGYRPISVDWYGHGKTPIPKQPVTAADFASDLKLLLDSLDINGVVIAGHSRGGVLASEFYRNFPDTTLGLVLIDGGSTCVANYFAGLGTDGLAQWMDSGFDKNGKPLAPDFASLEELFDANWRRFGKPKDSVEMFDVISQSAMNDQGRWTRWRQSTREWLGQDNRDRTFRGMLEPEKASPFISSTVLFDPLKTFADLDKPMLILDAVGSNVRYRDTTPIEENQQLQRLHPEFIKHIKVQSGHFVHREKPEEFANYLKNFRKRLN